LGRFDEDVAVYDKALAIDPNDIGALYHKGITLDNFGKI
jgi:tetratricopeptide repeat protein